MPITPLDLTKRSELPSALSQAQHDANLTAIENAVNAVIALAQLALKDDGTPKDGMVNRTAAIADGIVTLAKLSAAAEGDRGKFLRANATTGALEYAPRLHTDLKSVSTEIHLTGEQAATSIGTFAFADVPAGTVMVWCTVMARREAGANGGTIRMMSGDNVLDDVATHGIDDSGNLWKQYTLIGRLTGFVGGALEIKLEFDTSESSSSIVFGVEGEGRFGRKAMIQAGL